MVACTLWIPNMIFNHYIRLWNCRQGTLLFSIVKDGAKSVGVFVWKCVGGMGQIVVVTVSWCWWKMFVVTTVEVWYISVCLLFSSPDIISLLVIPTCFLPNQTDNSSLFCMANEKTWRSSKSADHGSVIICLLSCNSSDTQRTDATLEN